MTTASAAAVVMVLLAIAATRDLPRPVSARPEILDAAGIVRQRGRYDCGLAAAAMLIRAAGRELDEEELWRARVVPRGGLSLEDLVNVTAQFGVTTAPFAASARHDRTPPPPWIAHLSSDHYVLVEGRRDGRVVIADPRGSRYALSEDAFARAWSGYAVILANANIPR